MHMQMKILIGLQSLGFIGYKYNFQIIWNQIGFTWIDEN